MTMTSVAVLSRPMPEMEKTQAEIEREKALERAAVFALARRGLMSGPNATPPRPSTVRRIIKQAKFGLPIDGRRVILPGGRIAHPTKGVRNGTTKAGLPESIADGV